ncbi:predicted protein [Arabidopsis lyrata subsp. lyrata]|uniref:Predicted protein n=1 Tax=Arabidopsis lyrata subsp. lyrata TaxID=81972 RepID=D7KP19_ARALL|nr:predicted protein [Arabidopsis lyrata subsp. lyrata]
MAVTEEFSTHMIKMKATKKKPTDDTTSQDPKNLLHQHNPTSSFDEDAIGEEAGGKGKIMCSASSSKQIQSL